MRKVFENVIDNGGFDLSDMLSKIDSFYIDGRITTEDREVLIKKARAKAQTKDSVDMYAKLMELEERIRKLEQGERPDTPSGEYPEYVVGKWYYAGDKISYKGKNYVCSAPYGVVCTWSPDEYPAYWEVA